MQEETNKIRKLSDTQKTKLMQMMMRMLLFSVFDEI